MTAQTCSRCGTEIERPIPQHANYVIGDDFVEDEPVEVTYAYTHTEKTKEMLDRLDSEMPDRKRQALNAESAHPDAPDEVEVADGKRTRTDDDGNEVTTAQTKTIQFSIPTDKYDVEEVESPDVVKEHDDIALTFTKREERPVQKTGLVCSECLDPDDEIVWGVDE